MCWHASLTQCQLKHVVCCLFCAGFCSPWCFLQLPAVIAVYAGSEQLPAAVEAAVRAQQNNATSVSMGLASVEGCGEASQGWAVDAV